MKAYKEILAHKDKCNGRKQSLENHLFGVAEKASIQANHIGFKYTAYLLGVMHDIGKASSQFQNMLANDSKEHVDHSTAGVIYMRQFRKALEKKCPSNVKAEWKEFSDMMQYVIACHHGVHDFVAEMDKKGKVSYNFLRCYNDYQDKEKYKEIDGFYKAYCKTVYEIKGLTLEELYLKAFDEYILSKNKLEASGDEYIYFYIRLFLGFLKMADIEDTINAYEEVITISEESHEKDYVEKVEEFYKSFGTPRTEINIARKNISERIKTRGQQDKTGIYRLDLPTGAGKTLCALRYGTWQMFKNNKKKIIYITAFLSVLEQNAEVFKHILGEENVLEHHSNIVNNSEENTDQDDWKKYVVSTWSEDIVISTMVQFFNNLMINNADCLRRFVSMKESVIIIDEVQSLPTKVNYILTLGLNFLSKIMDTSIVLCTATQPPYDNPNLTYKLMYGDEKGKNVNLVELDQYEKKSFERTDFNNLGMLSIRELGNRVLAHEHNESILIVLNTKKAVRKLYDEINERKAEDRRIYYLTTELCPEHRRKRIDDIKADLEKQRPIICVSTQLIEAGVDLDFDKVIRSYAGIDSVIQAAGRCNRNGNKKTGHVELVCLSEKEENTISLEDLNDKKNITTNSILDIKGPINIEKLSKEFFEKYYIESEKKMYYSIGKDKTSLISKMVNGENIVRRDDYNKTGNLTQPVKTIGNNFKLIDQGNAIPVVVPYDDKVNEIEVKKLIDEAIEKVYEFEETYNTELLGEIKKCIKRLQPYTINMYVNEKNRSMLMAYMPETSMEFYVLADGYYSEEFGVIQEISDICLLM